MSYDTATIIESRVRPKQKQVSSEKTLSLWSFHKRINIFSQVELSLSLDTTTPNYDASKGEYVDMLKAGIIDPTKVVRSALSNAASIAGLMLTTQVLVTSTDDDGEKAPKVEGAVR